MGAVADQLPLSPGLDDSVCSVCVFALDLSGSNSSLDLLSGFHALFTLSPLGYVVIVCYFAGCHLDIKCTLLLIAVCFSSISYPVIRSGYRISPNSYVVAQ